MPGRVLILAGTGHARQLCARVADRDVLASLAGLTAAPCDLGVPVRVGGFGGEQGFRAALTGVSGVVVATHPFAARIGARTARICAELRLPCLRLTVPPWPFEAGWSRHPDAEAAAAALPVGARVMLTTGPGSHAPFLGRGLKLWCRRIDAAADIAGLEWIVGRPPFTLAEEMARMESLGVTHLVSKNAGGARAKLDAAAKLGVAVLMIDRPPPENIETTYDIDRAEAFVRTHAAPLPDHRRA